MSEYVKMQQDARALSEEYTRKTKEFEQAKITYLESQAKMTRLKNELKYDKERIVRITDDIRRMEEGRIK